MPASDPEPIRILPAAALGDGLLAMVLAANLQRVGRDVFIHHDGLLELAAWYPHAQIKPALDAGTRAAKGQRPELAALLAESAQLFVGDPAWMQGLEDLRADEAGLYIFRKHDWERSQHVLENMRQGAARHFGLPHWREDPWLDSDGLVAPSACVLASTPARVCLHPSSARLNKNWPAAQFLALADRLATEGHEPVFLSAPDEEAHWLETLGQRYEIVVPGRLDKVAAYLRASGGAIVTDSGIGHLAAAVGTPTLSLFRKKSSARFWRPRGQHVRALTASLRLPGGTGHRHWARFLTPKRVHAAYRELVTPSAAR